MCTHCRSARARRGLGWSAGARCARDSRRRLIGACWHPCRSQQGAGGGRRVRQHARIRRSSRVSARRCRWHRPFWPCRSLRSTHGHRVIGHRSLSEGRPQCPWIKSGRTIGQHRQQRLTDSSRRSRPERIRTARWYGAAPHRQCVPDRRLSSAISQQRAIAQRERGRHGGHRRWNRDHVCSSAASLPCATQPRSLVPRSAMGWRSTLW